MNSHRNPVAVACRLRYGKTTTTMKDRRAPRGGSRNEQHDLLAELETDELELETEESDAL
jgi:hypothetical protein